MSDEIKTPPTNTTAPQPSVTELPLGGGVVIPAGGGAVAAPSTTDVATTLPTGGITLAGGPDAVVADALKNAVPAFGNVIAAIGAAAGRAQKTLDDAAIKAIQKLNDTTIDVVTQVQIELDPNTGLPFTDGSHVTLAKSSVSLAQFYTPPVPIVRRVVTAMDLIVGAFHASQGVQFAAKQSNTSIGGSLSWHSAFTGFFNASHSSASSSGQVSTSNDAEFISGQLLMDAELGSRTTAPPPAATQITIGPQILVLQGKISEVTTNNVVSQRNAKIEVQIRKASGAVNAGATVGLEAPGLGGGGNQQTDSDGKTEYTLQRNLPAGTTGFRQFPLTVVFGDIRKSLTLTV